MFIESSDKCLHVGIGDLNGRPHGRLNGEEDVIGPHTYGRGNRFIRNLPIEDKEQRNLLIACLKASEHVHMNSFFEKADHQKVTRADWNATGPPYSPDRYAEIDGILPNQRTKNMIKDIEGDTKTYSPSDHFPVNWRFKNQN